MSMPNVRKLLRVLVAGGVALAGVEAARAQDKGAAATENAEKGKEKDQDAKAKADKERQDQEKKAREKKAEEAKKAAESEGGGVKGW